MSDYKLFIFGNSTFFIVISFGYLGPLRNNPSYPTYKKQLRT